MKENGDVNSLTTRIGEWVLLPVKFGIYYFAKKLSQADIKNEIHSIKI